MLSSRYVSCLVRNSRDLCALNPKLTVSKVCNTLRKHVGFVWLCQTRVPADEGYDVSAQSLVYSILWKWLRWWLQGFLDVIPRFVKTAVIKTG